MAGCFFVVVDRRDSEKFRLFRQGNTTAKVKGNSAYVWAVSESSANKLWSQLKENDTIFFGLEKSTFECQGHLLGKRVDKDSSIKMWGNDARSKMLDHLLIFKKLEPCAIGYNRMLRYGGLRDAIVFPGTYKVQNKFVKELLGEEKSPAIKQELKPVKIPVDYARPPAKVGAKVLRFIRDTRKSKLLKRKYENRCQVCNYRLEITDRVYYSEVHHLYPLKDGGPDSFDNMIVLCPTHHAEFDFKVLGVAEDGRTVIDKDGKVITRLTIHDDHVLAERNVHMQLSGIRSN